MLFGNEILKKRVCYFTILNIILELIKLISKSFVKLNIYYCHCINNFIFTYIRIKIICICILVYAHTYYKYNLISSSLTAEGVNIPKSVKRRLI